MNYFIGLCIGTSSTKGLLVDTDGKTISSSSSEYTIETPHPGWTEQDPDKWLESAINVIKNLLDKSMINPKDVISFGISGQMHSAVFLDGNNKVIRPAPLWNDQRTSFECDYLIKNIGIKKILELTSNRPLTAFTLLKLLWLKNNEIDNFKRLKKVCLSKDYIKMKLTESLSTDPSDASGTLCFDVKNHKWSRDLFKLLGLDFSILPEIRGSAEFSAFLSKEASKITGLPSGLPVLTGCADTSAEMIGNGINKDGECLIILGTGGVILIYHSKYYSNDGNLDMFCYPDGRYYSLGVTLSSAGSLSWGLNNIGFDLSVLEEKINLNFKYSEFKNYIEKNKFQILHAQLERIPPGSEGLVFLPYLAGERAPYSDSDVRGVLFGLSLNHSKGHILKSIMEGVAFSQRDCYEIINKKGFKINKIMITGGGSRDDLWCQIYSDIFNADIVRISSRDSAALGMCILGAVSTGVYNSINEANKRFLKTEAVFSPDDKNVKIYNELYEIYKNLYPSLKKSFYKLGIFQKKYK